MAETETKTETVEVETKVEPEVKVEPKVEAQAEAKTEGEAKTEATAEAKTEAKPASRDWREARIDVLTAKLRQAEAEARAAAAKTTATTETKALDPAANIRLDEAEIDRRASERAQQQSQWDSFNRSCNDAAQAGRLAFTDFDTRVGELRKLFDPNDPTQVANYNGFLAAALETGEAPRLIHELGGDLNEAQRILSLPPLKMAVELTKRAARAPGQVSGAPKPITTVGSRGASHAAIDPADPDRSDGLSTKAWMERREAQVKAQREGRA